MNVTGKYRRSLLFVSSVVVLLIMLLGALLPVKFAAAAGWLLNHITMIFGDWFIVIICSLVLLYFFIACSRFGKLKLGQKDDVKEFSDFSWFAMLLSCGIGMGFLFWGIAEPMTHFMVASPHNPYPVGDPAGYASAMKIAIFHWGIHGWVGYMALGVPIGYFAYRYHMPITPSSAFYGLLGRKMKGGWQFVCDLISIFATVLGVATTIGMGLMTMSFGISQLFHVEVTTMILVVIMIVIVVCYLLSAASGIHRGVKRLSDINVYLCIALMAFIFLLGPSRYQINLILESIGSYINDFIYMGFYTATSGQYESWVSGWTVFYWCWFLSWGPFVGGFVAKISKGRSLRQYIFGSVLLPTVFTLVWFCVLGGTSMYYEVHHVVELWESLELNLGSGIFVLLTAFPAEKILSVVVLISLLLFLITTADSASILCAMMVMKNGYEPSVGIRCFWGCLIGITGTILLVAGGLSSVQSACIVAALPLSFVVVMVNIAFVRALLRYEYKDGNNGDRTPYDQFSVVREDIAYLYPVHRDNMPLKELKETEEIADEKK